MVELNGHDFVKWERIKAIGVVLLGIASIITAVCLVLLLGQNNDLDARLECRAQRRDALDEAIGRGLVAVANEDSEALQEQAELIIIAAERIGEC